MRWNPYFISPGPLGPRSARRRPAHAPLPAVPCGAWARAPPLLPPPPPTLISASIPPHADISLLAGTNAAQLVKPPSNQEKKKQIAKALPPDNRYRCPQICFSCLKKGEHWLKPDPMWNQIVCEPVEGVECEKCASELKKIKAIPSSHEHVLKDVKPIFQIGEKSHFKHLWTEHREPKHNSVRFGSEMQKALYFREKEGEIYVKLELFPGHLRWGFAVSQHGKLKSMIYRKPTNEVGLKFLLLTKSGSIPEKLQFFDTFQLESPPEYDFDFSNIQPKLRHNNSAYFETLLEETSGVEKLVVECFMTFSLHWTQTKPARVNWLLDNIPSDAPASVKALKLVFKAILKYKSPLLEVSVNEMKELSLSQLRKKQKDYYSQALHFYHEAVWIRKNCGREFHPWLSHQYLDSNIGIISLQIHEYGLENELATDLRKIFGDVDILDETKALLEKGHRKFALKSFGCFRDGTSLMTEICEKEEKVREIYAAYEEWENTGEGKKPKVRSLVETICHWLVLSMKSANGEEKEKLRRRGLKWVRTHLGWIRRTNNPKKPRKLREMEMLGFKLWFENA